MKPENETDNGTDGADGTDGTDGTDVPLEPNGNSFRFHLAIFFSVLGGFLFGYDTGIISGAMLLMKSEFNLTIFQQSAIVTVTILGAWLFSLVSGYSADRIGRKNIIFISSVIFTVGSLTMGLATSPAFLIGGRFILGMAIGLSSSNIPIYIAEITQFHQRGKLVATDNALITAGQFGSSVFAGLLSTTSGGWRYMILLAVIPSVLQAIYFLFAYESPRYLLKIGKEKEAYQSLKSLRSDESLARTEFEQIKRHVKSQVEESKRIGNAGVLDVLKRIRTDLPLRRAVVLGCLLQLVQQFCGINIVRYYSATIIVQAGVADNSQAIWYSCGVGLGNFLLTFSLIFFIERLGRRRMLLSSLVGICLSLLFLSGSFYVARYTAPAVTEVSDLNSTCSTISSCNSCVSRSECGFCYTKNGTELQSTCLPIDKNDPDHSTGGWCSANYTLDQLPSKPTFAASNCPSNFAYLIIIGLVLYLIAFACGLGPIVWVVNSEIYPLNFRSGAFALCVALNWLSNTLVSMSYLYLSRLITEAGVFAIYLAFSLAGLVYFWRHLPETKGKKLEEIEKLFKRE